MKTSTIIALGIAGVGLALLASDDKAANVPGKPPPKGGTAAKPALGRTQVQPPTRDIDPQRVANDWGENFVGLTLPAARVYLGLFEEFLAWCTAGTAAMVDAMQATIPRGELDQKALTSAGTAVVEAATGSSNAVEVIFDSASTLADLQITGSKLAEATRDVLNAANALAGRLDNASRDRAFERVDGSTGLGSLALPLHQYLAHTLEPAWSDGDGNALPQSVVDELQLSVGKLSNLSGGW